MPRSLAHRALPCLLALPSALFLALFAAGCQESTPEADAATEGPIALLDQWSDVRIADAVEVDAQKTEVAPSIVHFDRDGGGVEAEWSALAGIENLRVENGLLLGRSTSEAPILVVDFAEPQGTDDELWSMELALRTSAGTRLAMHPLLEPGPPIEAVKARVEDWPISSAIADASSEIRSFSVVLDRVFLFEMPPAQTSIRGSARRPTNVAGADFAIESMRLVFRKERLASIDSGPGWHGLGEVFRETIVSRAPETLRFEVELPERPWLDLAVGSIDQASPTFTVEVAAAGAEKSERVAELRAEAPEAWRMERVDLGPWAGRKVELRLRATGEPGQLAFWGAPTVRSSMAELEGPEAQARPRAVVVFLADTLRADHLDAWGYGRETAPNLSRLAGGGVRFANTVSQATWTKVSVSSILTSLYPSTTGVAGLHDRISAGETTLAEVFKDAGYATFATSSVPFSGQLTNLHQGVEVMHETGALRGQSASAYLSKSAEPWVDAYLEWLDVHRDVPTFALIHAMDPHSPFKPKAPFDTMWADAESAARFEEQAETVRPHIESPLLQRFMAPTRDELAKAGVDAESFVDHEKSWYDGSIRGLDHELGRLVEHLESLGLGESALLAFVADHGEAFLEHGRHWHGEDVYGEVANVPMAFWGSGVPEGVVVEEVVQTIDLMPTLLDLAGLEAPERVQGQSLRPLFEGGDPRPRPAFIEHPVRAAEAESEAYAIVDGDHKLVWYPARERLELYDRAADPLDQTDLAAEQPEIVERLHGELERFLTWARNQRLDDAALESEMSAEQLEQLRSLGYVE